MRPAVAAAVVGLAGVAGCAALAFLQPDDVGPALCPIRALFGMDCPGCGSLRGLGALMSGRIGDALDHNVLLVAIVPALIVVYAAWAASAFGWTRPLKLPLGPRALLVAATVVLSFTVVRNLPLGGFVEYLGSGLS